MSNLMQTTAMLARLKKDPEDQAAKDYLIQEINTFDDDYYIEIPQESKDDNKHEEAAT